MARSSQPPVRVALEPGRKLAEQDWATTLALDVIEHEFSPSVSHVARALLELGSATVVEVARYFVSCLQRGDTRFGAPAMSSDRVRTALALLYHHGLLTVVARPRPPRPTSSDAPATATSKPLPTAVSGGGGGGGGPPLSFRLSIHAVLMRLHHPQFAAIAKLVTDEVGGSVVQAMLRLGPCTLDQLHHAAAIIMCQDELRREALDGGVVGEGHGRHDEEVEDGAGGVSGGTMVGTKRRRADGGASGSASASLPAPASLPLGVQPGRYAAGRDRVVRSWPALVTAQLVQHYRAGHAAAPATAGADGRDESKAGAGVPQGAKWARVQSEVVGASSRQRATIAPEAAEAEEGVRGEGRVGGAAGGRSVVVASDEEGEAPTTMPTRRVPATSAAAAAAAATQLWVFNRSTAFCYMKVDLVLRYLAGVFNREGDGSVDMCKQVVRAMGRLDWAGAAVAGGVTDAHAWQADRSAPIATARLVEEVTSMAAAATAPRAGVAPGGHVFVPPAFRSPMSTLPARVREALATLATLPVSVVSPAPAAAVGGSGSGRGEAEAWVLEYRHVITALQFNTVKQAIMNRFEHMGSLMAHALMERGAMEERTLAEAVFMEHGKARTALGPMLRAGFAEMEEVPRRADYHAQFTYYLVHMTFPKLLRRCVEMTHQGVLNMRVRWRQEAAACDAGDEAYNRASLHITPGQEAAMLLLSHGDVDDVDDMPGTIQMMRRERTGRLLAAVQRAGRTLFLLRDLAPSPEWTLNEAQASRLAAALEEARAKKR